MQQDCWLYVIQVARQASIHRVWYGSRGVSMSRTSWLTFFLLHGLICTGEEWTRKSLDKSGITQALSRFSSSLLLQVLQRLYFCLLLIWTVRTYFLPPAYESGLPMIAAHAFMRGPTYVASFFT
eukprot:g28811.t1